MRQQAGQPASQPSSQLAGQSTNQLANQLGTYFHHDGNSGFKLGLFTDSRDSFLASSPWQQHVVSQPHMRVVCVCVRWYVVQTSTASTINVP